MCETWNSKKCTSIDRQKDTVCACAQHPLQKRRMIKTPQERRMIKRHQSVDNETEFDFLWVAPSPSLRRMEKRGMYEKDKRKHKTYLWVAPTPSLQNLQSQTKASSGTLELNGHRLIIFPFHFENHQVSLRSLTPPPLTTDGRSKKQFQAPQNKALLLGHNIIEGCSSVIPIPNLAC